MGDDALLRDRDVGIGDGAAADADRRCKAQSGSKNNLLQDMVLVDFDGGETS